MKITANDNSILTFRPNVPVSFYWAYRYYESGTLKAEWRKFDDNGMMVFWSDWRTTFGTLAAQYMSIGVKDVCVLKLNYHPTLYRFLQDKEVVIAKFDDIDVIRDDGTINQQCVNAYKLYSNVDNIKELDRIMTFKVIRMEQK